MGPSDVPTMVVMARMEAHAQSYTPPGWDGLGLRTIGGRRGSDEWGVKGTLRVMWCEVDVVRDCRDNSTGGSPDESED